MMKKYFVLLLLFTTIKLRSQSLYFPPLTGNTWDTLSLSSLGWCADKLPDLLNYLEDKNSKAFILLKDGKIVVEKYFGTFTMDSVWYWASAGKSLTSFLVGIAQQEGKLSITDTTSKYLGKGWTNCTQAKEEKITIWNQLTMTSGLNDGVPDHHCTLDTCLNYKADAGTRWAYHNGPYTLLDDVMEAATGQNLNTWVNVKLKVSTGITGAFFPSGYNNLFISKPRSMARYGLLILNKGTWNSTKILSDTAYFRKMVNTSQNLNRSYGYLWWLNGKQNFMVPGLQVVIPGSLNPSAPTDMIAALGKNGQILNVVPSQNLVYIRMGDAPGVGDVPILFNDTIWQKLNAIMCGTSDIKTTASDISVPQLYPNPAQESSIAEWTGQSFYCRILDATGRNIYCSNITSGSVVLPISFCKNGMYTVQFVSTSGAVRHQKLLISK